MLFSIIIPIYNVEKYLRRCIESVVLQNYSDFEVLLINDGSPDNSEKICEEYFYDDRIKYIKKDNGGLSSARNMGLDYAQGKYILFLDSDDYIANDCLEKIKDIVNEKQYDLISINARIEYDDKTYKDLCSGVATGEYYVEAYMKEVYAKKSYRACAPYFIYNKSYIEKNNFRFYNGILHEDELWTPQVVMQASSIYCSNILVYYHCLRKGSITQSDNYYKRGKSLITVLTELIKSFNKNNRVPKVFREQWAFLFLEAICFLECGSEITDICTRFFPFKNSYSLKMRLKSLLYAISPKLYFKVWKALKKN